MKILCLMALVTLGLSAAAGERLSSKDFEQAKKMTKGTLYLRVDAPCIFSAGGGMYGPALMAEAPVVVATPSGSNTDLAVADRVVASRAAWVLRPNDPVANGKLYYTRTGDLEFDFEGLGLFSKSQESLVTFSEIHSLDDFQKAFDRVFSRVPLQDAHPEWPADVRVAVKEHRLIEGMAPEQAHAVIGAPARVDTDKTEGKVVDKWYSRPMQGAAVGAPAPPRNRGQQKRADGIVPSGPRQSPTWFPPVIVFLDGKLTTAEVFYTPTEREALLRFGKLPSTK